MAANDGLDLDLGAAPMLYWNNKGDPMVALGSKDGHVYGVNRETHRRVYMTAVTTIEKPRQATGAKGVHTCPGALGGVEWTGVRPQDPAGGRGLARLVRRRDRGRGQIGPRPFPVRWQRCAGRGTQRLGARLGSRHRQSPLGLPRRRAGGGGVTPTAGGRTLTGDMTGNLLVLNSASGEVVLKQPTGGAWAGGVITYARDGRQYVAVAAGNVSSRLSFGESGKPTLIVYALPHADEPTAVSANPAPATADATDPKSLSASATDLARGRVLFGQHCAACHGAKGEGGGAPPLRGLQARRDFAVTVLWIVPPANKMPKLCPSILDARAVADVAAFVQGW